MSKPSTNMPILTSEAWIWNGHKQLPGQIQLWPDRLFFALQDFPDSHLNLEIFLSEVVEIESFLVFAISRLGLMVRTADGKTSRFILKNPEEVRRVMNELKSQL